MARLQRILCAIDFSSPSRAALEHALLLARKDQAGVHIVHVLTMPSVALAETSVFATPELGQKLRDACESSMRDLVAEHSRDAGVPLTHHVVSGSVAEEIVAEARRIHADLIVVGTAGRTGVPRFLLGSVAERVVRTSPVDVLTVPIEAVGKKPAPIGSILCAVDFSAESETAFLEALDLARRHGAVVHVAHAWEVAAYSSPRSELALGHEKELALELDQLVDRHPAPGVEIVRHVCRGIPYAAIVELAGELGVDMIVAGTTGKSGLDHFFLGSVAERVVRASAVPVLTVRRRHVA
jgi:nucleotide-binding universal stress UspA family protein